MLFTQLGRLLPAHRLLPLQEFHQDGFKQQMVGPQNWSRGCGRGWMQENAADTNKSVEAAIWPVAMQDFNEPCDASILP